MIEVVTIREVRCPLCGYIARLQPREPRPEKCPACGDGKPAMWSAGPKKGWTA